MTHLLTSLRDAVYSGSLRDALTALLGERHPATLALGVAYVRNAIERGAWSTQGLAQEAGDLIHEGWTVHPVWQALGVRSPEADARAQRLAPGVPSPVLGDVLRGNAQVAALLQRSLVHEVGTWPVLAVPALDMSGLPDAPTCAQVSARTSAHLAQHGDQRIPGQRTLIDLDGLTEAWRLVWETCTGRSSIYARQRPGACEGAGLELRLDKYRGHYEPDSGRLWRADVKRGVVTVTVADGVPLSECDEEWVLRCIASALHSEREVRSLRALPVEVHVGREAGAEHDDPVVAYWEDRLGA